MKTTKPKYCNTMQINTLNKRIETAINNARRNFSITPPADIKAAQDNIVALQSMVGKWEDKVYEKEERYSKGLHEKGSQLKQDIVFRIPEDALKSVEEFEAEISKGEEFEE